MSTPPQPPNQPQPPYPAQPPAYYPPPRQTNLFGGFALAVGLFALLGSCSVSMTGSGAQAGTGVIVVAVIAIGLGVAGVVRKGYTKKSTAIWGICLGALAFMSGVGSSSTAAKSTTASSTSSGSSVSAGTVSSPGTADTADQTQFKPTATSIPGKGTFLVGSEITPGTYRSAGAQHGVFEFCSWSRLRDTAGGSGSVLQFGSANADDQMIVTILPSDGAFQTSNCEAWTRIK